MYSANSVEGVAPFLEQDNAESIISSIVANLIVFIDSIVYTSPKIRNFIYNK